MCLNLSWILYVLLMWAAGCDSSLAAVPVSGKHTALNMMCQVLWTHRSTRSVVWHLSGESKLASCMNCTGCCASCAALVYRHCTCSPTEYTHAGRKDCLFLLFCLQYTNFFSILLIVGGEHVDVCVCGTNDCAVLPDHMHKDLKVTRGDSAHQDRVLSHVAKAESAALHVRHHRA